MIHVLRRPLIKLCVAILVLVPAIASGASPAAADTRTATGVATFSGEATLSRFPCQQPPPFGNGPCGGLFYGSWAGNLTGTYNGAPYEVVWESANVRAVHAAFSYYEAVCLVPEAGSLVGFAAGGGSATAGSNEVVGAIYNAVGGLPALITHVRLDFSFDWVRLGNSAAITLSSFTFWAQLGDGTWLPLVNSAQTGAASFVPTHSEAPTGVPSCTTPLTDVKGQISGSIPIAQGV